MHTTYPQYNSNMKSILILSAILNTVIGFAPVQSSTRISTSLVSIYFFAHIMCSSLAIYICSSCILIIDSSHTSIQSYHTTSYIILNNISFVYHSSHISFLSLYTTNKQKIMIGILWRSKKVNN